MRLLAALPFALLPLATAAAAPSAREAPNIPPTGEIRLLPAKACGDSAIRRADAPGAVRARRLDRLPQGNLSLAVMREVGGCPQPTIVRQGYGAPAFRDGR